MSSGVPRNELLRTSGSAKRCQISHLSLLGAERPTGAPSNEVTAIPRPILPVAKEFFDNGVRDLNEGRFEEGFSAARKAEELDPANVDVKELLRRLKKAREEGLIQRSEK